MLVIDFDPLAAINALNLVQQILLDGFFTGDSQNIVRNQRSVDQSLAGLHEVARVNEESFTVWNQVLSLETTFTANDDRTFSTSLFTQDFDGSIHFGDYGRIFGLTSFENLGYSWQTTGDILNPGSFTRRFCDDRTCRDLSSLFDFDVGSFR